MLRKVHKKTEEILMREEKRGKRIISRREEKVIGKIKRIHIISQRYRNRRKDFGLRFNLIAAIYNFELCVWKEV